MKQLATVIKKLSSGAYSIKASGGSRIVHTDRKLYPGDTVLLVNGNVVDTRKRISSETVKV